MFQATQCFLVVQENLFAYGPDVLHDDRHIKKRHIGLFATNLINAVRGKLERRVPFVQEIHLRPLSDRHHPLWENTRHTATRYRTTKLDSQQTPPAEYRETRSPFLRQKMEQGQRYNDAISNELISFLRFIKSYL